MSVDIRVVESKKELKAFVKVPFKIFKGNPYWVPSIILDDMDTFNKKKNPALETAECRLFIAYKDGTPVGRVAGILSHVANEKYNTRNLRFGWFDTPDDYEVAETLFSAVEEWGKELGMETLTGPHGFTDLDPEGMLIKGFEELPTIAVYYNHPYYPEFVEKYGFEKDVDYIELQAKPPTEIPERLQKLAERIKERSNIKLLRFKSKRELRPLIPEVFRLIDETFEELYGTVPISEKQMYHYAEKYFPFVDKELLQVAANEKGEFVGFLLAVPSLSKAFQKAKGRLLPFGWYHILRAVKGKTDIMDLYLAGIKKRYRGQGIDLLMVLEAARAAIRKGFTIAESNPELELNTKIQAQWKHFNPRQHKRRRIYKKKIGK